jgi:uncharacterized DUF497 family protein
LSTIQAKARQIASSIKHAIDFEQAQRLWQDPLRVQLDAKSITEPRFLVIGNIGNKLWTAIVTYRGEKVRIISVRRSENSEIKVYESN